MNRVLGVLEGSEPGPLNILLGGVHGNEAGGIKAINEVFHTIKSHKIPVKGTLVGLAGNLQALSKNKRYIDYDLNRCWTQDTIDKVYRKEQSRAEDIELYALQETIHYYKKKARGNIKIIMDLHTTSSARGNFVVIPENESGHPIIRSLKQPVVIDLDKYLQGTLLKYFRDHGFIAFAFEGGMIGSSEAVALHVAGIWELLQAAGNIDPRSDDSFLTYRNLLEQYSQALPHYIKVLYHHRINQDDGFTMNPGYENFQPVKTGEIIAHDRRGAIAVHLDGLIFLPLYQSSGNDGFFIVEEVPLMELS